MQNCFAFTVNVILKRCDFLFLIYCYASHMKYMRGRAKQAKLEIENSPKNISMGMNEHLNESNELLTLKFESVEDKNIQS